MSKSPEIKPGDKLKMKNNTYEVVSVLGDGGFGTVFKGKIAKNSSEVTMKFFKTQAFTSPAECRMYWERESELSEIQSRYKGSPYGVSMKLTKINLIGPTQNSLLFLGSLKVQPLSHGLMIIYELQKISAFLLMIWPKKSFYLYRST